MKHVYANFSLFFGWNVNFSNASMKYNLALVVSSFIAYLSGKEGNYDCMETRVMWDPIKCPYLSPPLCLLTSLHHSSSFYRIANSDSDTYGVIKLSSPQYFCWFPENTTSGVRDVGIIIASGKCHQIISKIRVIYTKMLFATGGNLFPWIFFYQYSLNLYLFSI